MLGEGRGLGYCGASWLVQGKKWGREVLPAAASTAPARFNFTIISP